MNKFENHIRSNRDLFDTHEPAAGHKERFMQKLKPAPISLFQRIPYQLKAAIVLLLVAVSSILIYEHARHYYISQRQGVEKIIPGEFGEAQVYYSALINEKYSEINQLIAPEPVQKELLIKELKDMDRMFQSLQKDFQTNPTDERILSAMIEHYQMKLDIMSQIVQQLRNANQNNLTYQNHENTDI